VRRVTRPPFLDGVQCICGGASCLREVWHPTVVICLLRWYVTAAAVCNTPRLLPVKIIYSPNHAKPSEGAIDDFDSDVGGGTDGDSDVGPAGDPVRGHGNSTSGRNRAEAGAAVCQEEEGASTRGSGGGADQSLEGTPGLPQLLASLSELAAANAALREQLAALTAKVDDALMRPAETGTGLLTQNILTA
jgi:hypothetical protein